MDRLHSYVPLGRSRALTMNPAERPPRFYNTATYSSPAERDCPVYEGLRYNTIG